MTVPPPMQVHHFRSTETTPGGRGSELGRRWYKPIATAIDLYQQHFRLLGIDERRVRRIAEGTSRATADWAPELAEEQRAIAVAAGVEPWRLAMLNARTEILAIRPRPEAVECSTAVRLTGRPVAFQTWDWYAALVPDALLWTFTGTDGHRVTTFTEPGMAAKIGVNSAGLSLNFNILAHSSDGSTTDGVPVHVVARRVLDRAHTVSEAMALAASAPLVASSVLTVLTGGAQPQAACIELAPSGAARVDPHDGWLVHTNHFLDPLLAAGGAVDPVSTTGARMDHLLRTVRAIDDGVAPTDLASVSAALCGSAGARAPICMAPPASGDPGGPRPQTMITLLLDPAAGTVDYRLGAPARVDAGTS